MIETTCNLCGKPIMTVIVWKGNRGKGIAVCERCREIVKHNGDGWMLDE